MNEFRQLTRVRQKLSDEETMALLKKEKRGVLSVEYYLIVKEY